MNDLAHKLGYSWNESRVQKEPKTRAYRYRVKNQSPVVSIIKILLVLGMGLGAIIRLVVELSQSIEY